MSNIQKNNKPNVPNLRFPEFSGEWEKRKLASIGKFFSGGTPTSSNKDYYDGEIPFIRSGEIHSDHTELSISAIGYENSSAKMVSKGDLLLALYGATSGDIAISRMSGAINQAILCIRTTQDHLFLKSVWEKHVKNILNTYLQGGQGNLSADIVKNLFFYFPRIEEQRKIGRLIELIDQRIAIQNRIIEKYESLIKAIRRRTFASIKANTYMRLGDIAPNIASGKSKAAPGNITLFGSTGIIGTCGEAQYSGELILVARVGSVGHIQLIESEGCGISDNTIIINAGSRNRYVYYFLRTFDFAKITSGTTQPLITGSSLKEIEIPLLSEENSLTLVNCLMALDKCISIEKNTQQKYIAMKKVLLADMFI